MSDGDPAAAVLWSELSGPELAAVAARPGALALWPVGATEQHGPHLPTNVDIRNCWEIAVRVSEATGACVLPGLPFGDSRFWAGWPGTLSIGPATFADVLVDGCAGVVATGFERLLVLNGHLGNQWALALAFGRLRGAFPELALRVLSWWDVSPRVSEAVRADAVLTTGPAETLESFHANDGETSVYLAHSPELVRTALAVDELCPGQPSLLPKQSRELTATGSVGRPTLASAAKGRQLLEWAVEDLSALVRELTATGAGVAAPAGAAT